MRDYADELEDLATRDDGDTESVPYVPPEPMVTRYGALDMQVCVPAIWTDATVVTFAEREYPCGTQTGWHVRKEGSASLNGDPERVKCSQRTGFVHVMLDA
jgi:hypothetical protein